MNTQTAELETYLMNSKAKQGIPIENLKPTVKEGHSHNQSKEENTKFELNSSAKKHLRSVSLNQDASRNDLECQHLRKYLNLNSVPEASLGENFGSFQASDLLQVYQEKKEILEQLQDSHLIIKEMQQSLIEKDDIIAGLKDEKQSMQDEMRYLVQRLMKEDQKTFQEEVSNYDEADTKSIGQELTQQQNEYQYTHEDDTIIDTLNSPRQLTQEKVMLGTGTFPVNQQLNEAYLREAPNESPQSIVEYLQSKKKRTGARFNIDLCEN